MPARRGSAFYRSEMARMFDQFKPGFMVAPTFINSVNDALRGIVTAVNRAENKIYVAWNGGSVKQHDPDEVMVVSMPVHMSEAPAARTDAVMGNPTSGEENEAKQEFDRQTRRAHVGRRMAGGTVKEKTEAMSPRRMAMYHKQRGRFYKRTRAEAESDASTCPKCGKTMELEPFTKSEKLWRCPGCGWKIQTSRVLAKEQ